MSIADVIQSIDEQISRLQQARAILNGTRSGKATGPWKRAANNERSSKSQDRSRSAQEVGKG